MTDRIPLASLKNFDRHVLVPLRAQGVDFLDQLADLSMEQLCQLVPGEKSQEKIAKALGREAEYNEHRGKYIIEVNGEKVTGGEIAQKMGLVGTARALLNNPDATVADLKAALACGEVTKQKVAEYIAGSRIARRDLRASTHAAPSSVESPKANLKLMLDTEARILERIEQYKHDYDATKWTGADWDAVRRLSMLEIYAERTQELLLNRGHEASFQFAPQLKALTDQVTSSLKTIATMRDDMEVSLKARADRDRGAEAHEVITGFAKQAKELVAKRASILIHCGVRLGLVLPHFPRGLRVEGRVLQVCPVCGEEVEWPLVTPQMLQTYVEAGDFIPDGAPIGFLEGEKKRDMTSARHNIEHDHYHTATEL